MPLPRGISYPIAPTAPPSLPISLASPHSPKRWCAESSEIEVVRSAISNEPASFEPLAVVGDVPGADFALDEPEALADWIAAQMPAL